MAIAVALETGTMIAAPGACTRYVTLSPASPITDGGEPDAGGGGTACAGLGTPIRFPTAAGSVCTSALAARGNRFALCSCEDLDVAAAAPIYTDSFDSRTGSVAAGRSAAIGIGGLLTASAEIWAGGALYVASGIATVGHIETEGSLRSGTSLVIINADAHVAGDAYVDGSISGILRVDGILHQPSGAGMDPALIPESSIRRETVSVPAPCDCSTTFVDLGAAVAGAAAQNDDALVGLSPDALVAVTTATAVDVTCGVYVLSAIDAQKTLVFTVHGRSLLVVTGDVVVRAGLTVVLDPGAELDLLIGGRLVSSGGNPFGSASPARFRVWITGTDSVVLDDAPTVGAILRAPSAAVTASSGLQISGALLARSVMLGGQLNLHFDEAVVSSGAPCGEPAATIVQ